MTRLVLLLTCVLALALPAAASAADVFETVRVPTVDGNTIHVEVARPTGSGKVPIILTYSPYNSLSEYTTPNIANDGLYDTYGKKGYARAVADVLGTRNSSGCWDYGGKAEQQSGVDLVNALAKLPWSNGKVAMIGGSYDGTTANMVAARGADVPGLAAIVPQAAISRWYGYAYQDGVRYLGNTEVPSDEGFDTPLAFDFGLTRTPPTHPDAAAQTFPDRVSPCDAPEHTRYGYSRQPDYDGFWRERDYRKDARRFRVPVLVTHGWQDYNVKQSEGTDLFEALEGSDVPFKKLFVFQGPHGTPDHAEYDALLSRFFARTLKGVQNGIERESEVWTEGRDDAGVVKLRTEPGWPIPGTGTLSVTMKGGSFTDMASTSEEAALQDPSSESAWLYRVTEPLRRDARLAGSAVVDLVVRTSASHGQLAATLVDVAPDGAATPIARGHLNLQYRGGLAQARPMPVGVPQRARVRIAPQDQTVRKGHRVGLVLAGSNVAWAVPDEPGVEHTVDRMALRLPVVGPAPSPIPGATLGGAGSSDRGAPAARRAKRLTLRVRRVGTRIIATGRAPRGKRVSLRLTRRGGKRVTRRVTARRGTFRVTFKRVSRRRAVRVTARLTGTKLTATRHLAARRR